MKVRQFHVKNQFIISTPEGEYFQSYNSIIAFKSKFKIYPWGENKKYEPIVKLDEKYWDYSKTTGKYRNLYLGENKKTTQKKIDSGEYELVNLN